MKFHGAKLAILVGERVVTLLRDDLPGLPYAGHWDLPGGAREPGETPGQTVLRELKEELGLVFTADDLHWSRDFGSDDSRAWFFVSHQDRFDADAVILGDEGQGWKLASVDWFLAARAVPMMQERLKLYLDSRP